MLEYYSVITETWHPLKQVNRNKHTLYGNKRIYTRYYNLGYIRYAR